MRSCVTLAWCADFLVFSLPSGVLTQGPFNGLWGLGDRVEGMDVVNNSLPQ